MAFGPNSTNPRERRSYAHTKLAHLKRGEASYEETVAAIEAASCTRKGQATNFPEALGNTAVVLVDWGATSFRQHGIVHHNFGGYVMPPSETEQWTTLRNAIRARQKELGAAVYEGPDDPKLRSLYNQHNEVHRVGYPTAKFTRIFRSEAPLGEPGVPAPGDVINAAEIEDITLFIGWDNDQAVQTRITEIQ